MKTEKHTSFLWIISLVMATAIQLGFLSGAWAAESRPVLCVGSLMGVFADGVWQDAPGEVTVDGNIVNMEEVTQNKGLLQKIEQADDGLDCVTSLITAGQKIAYYGTDGKKKHEGAVLRSYIWCEGEASGALGLGIDVEGSEEIDWSELIVGVAATVMAAPAPTIRAMDGKAVTFTSEYKGEKYAVSWTPGKDDTFAIALSLGDKSWKLESEGISPADLEYLHCGFFDLNGDGSLELVISDAGPNGSIALYRFASDAEPERFAWQYTGEE